MTRAGSDVRRRVGGSEVVDRAVAAAEPRGLPRLVLETEKANEAARRFYSRHGFVSEDSVWMSLDLT